MRGVRKGWGWRGGGGKEGRWKGGAGGGGNKLFPSPVKGETTCSALTLR